MNALGVTIGARRFDHLYYHFTLTYSNWETGRVCVSECFESLSDALQGALWELGGVPRSHRTDRMSTAIKKTEDPDTFTDRYRALLRHYGIEGVKTNAASPNENGDVEERNHRFKRAVEQALLLRGSRDFESREVYASFLSQVQDGLNRGRRERLEEELRVLRRLPISRLDASKRLRARVRPSSTILVDRNVYSVDSRLLGEIVDVRLRPERIDVHYGQSLIHEIPRLRGRGKHRINYRHIIDWLIRKPGAFEHYVYREELFPTSRFRMAYDSLRHRDPKGAVRAYLSILRLAARESETAVDEALRVEIASGRAIHMEAVEHAVCARLTPPAPTDVVIEAVDLSLYDELLAAGVER